MNDSRAPQDIVQAQQQVTLVESDGIPLPALAAWSRAALTLFAATLFATAAMAETTPPATRTFTVQALVPVDAAGQGGTPSFSGELAPEARQLLTARIAGLEFEPATHDGRPVPSDLSLAVRLKVLNVEGRWRFEADHIAAAPVVTQQARYPGAALEQGLGAAIMLRVTVAARTGPERVTAIVLGADYLGQAVGKLQREAFTRAALASVNGCCSLFERIDGQPLAFEVNVPVIFIVDRDRSKFDAAAFSARWQTDAPALPRGLVRARIKPAP
ncbi:MAG: hypothetical protein DCF27_10790 [Lysobacteraceae bacterium]|nr:MAG: hypothetical protein DCF27_10790 [Xanthomonadaceae bacterium]